MKRILGMAFLVLTVFTIAACSTDSTTEETTMEEQTTEATTEEVTTEDNEPRLNIVETAEAAGSFTTLIAALEAADLRTTLEGDGQFTVFAPTDQAFTDLATSLEVSVQDLLALANLDQILLFHVINGMYYSTDVINAAPLSLASMQTTNLDFTLMNNSIYVNGIEVVIEDILTSNGIIHVIGEVLLYE